MTLTRDQILLLLAHIVRCQDVLAASIDRLSPMHFKPGIEIDGAYITAAAQGFYREHSVLPPRDALVAEMKALLDADGLGDPRVQESAVATIQVTYDLDATQILPAYGLHLLELFLDERAVRQELVEQINCGLPTDEIYDLFTKARAAATVRTPDLIDPFADGDPPDYVPRIPIGIPFLDDLIGGGIRRGESYGLLAGSGGGKTTLAIEAAIELARQGAHALYFSYEQAPDDEFMARVFSCATGVRRDRIAGRPWSDIDEPVKKKIDKAKAALAGYLHIADRSTSGDDLVEIESAIAELARTDRLPTLVIIDWLGPLVNRMAASTTSAVRAHAFKDIRHYVQHSIDRLKAIAGRHGTSFLVLHQLAVAQAKKSARATPEWFNAAEAGSFAWLLNACVAIGTPDRDGYCKAIGSKVRSGPRSEILVRLRGDYCRFEDVGADMAWDCHEKRYIPAEEMNVIPGYGKVGL